jgi:hypothetical protein
LTNSTGLVNIALVLESLPGIRGSGDRSMTMHGRIAGALRAGGIDALMEPV